ncbi:MAG TPA: hypothetical protein VFT22_22625 [Kofleriaceae bacterium]|nr:hypothetical protein [Kofleriaceae bacterium]
MIAMRRALGVVVAFIAGGAAALAVPVLGCSHDARPAAQPAEPPPLPPASGTPIGYLIDARELALSPEQATQLKAIDEDLADRLAAIEGSLRQSDPSAHPAPGQESNKGRGLGFRAGGVRGDQGGAGARQTVFPGDTSVPVPPPRGGDNPVAAGRAAEDRNDLIRDALARALGLLDSVQRIVARRVLTDHGVDPRTGGPLSAGTPAASPDGSGSGIIQN